MDSPTPKTDNENLSVLLQLESMARKAESEKALQFFIVNETRRLLNYRQAFLFSCQHSGQHRVETASSLSVVDRNSPFMTWLESTADSQFKTTEVTSAQKFDADSVPSEERKHFEDFSLPYVVYCPLLLPEGLKIGGLWLARETPWEDSELVLIERLSETYAHAWLTLVGRKQIGRNPNLRKWTFTALAALVLVSLIPVQMSTVAPAEIVPLNPVVVSAPIDGVIKELPVPPNTSVQQGDLVFRYEDTNLRNAYEIASRAYDVTNAQLRKATQGAFQDDASRGQVALLNAELALKETELAYAQELLGQVEVTATIDGLLVYSDESDWEGKPVAIGEKIMEIVDPNQVQFRIDVPVDDAIVLVDDAEVEVFLHANPLTSIRAKVTKASFNAYLTPANVLAYRVDASFVDQTEGARLGLQGSARIYGTHVSLFFYVFRRPISAFRQFVGL